VIRYDQKKEETTRRVASTPGQKACSLARAH
jgi:hypothetical protein